MSASCAIADAAASNSSAPISAAAVSVLNISGLNQKRNKEELRRSLSELKGSVNLYSKLKDLLPSVCKLFVSK